MHVTICETELRNLQDRWVEGEIYPNLVCLISELYSRKYELDHVYRELCQKLNSEQIGYFFESYLLTLNEWNPENMKQAREDKKELSRINKRITKLSAELASLLDERSQLNNSSHFRCNSIVRISDLITLAANGNGNYSSFIKDDITRLGNFDYDRYWPSISDLVRTLGVDAENLDVFPTNDLTEAVTKYNRSSPLDFLRAFLEEIESIKSEPIKNMPNDFSLTDSSNAVLVDCGLRLNGTFTEDSVKTMRFKSK